MACGGQCRLAIEPGCFGAGLVEPGKHEGITACRRLGAGDGIVHGAGGGPLAGKDALPGGKEV
jgi:hypothetical protein